MLCFFCSMRSIRGIFTEYSWSIHMYRVCIGNVSGMYRECIGNVSGMYRVCVGNVSEHTINGKGKKGKRED